MHTVFSTEGSRTCCSGSLLYRQWRVLQLIWKQSWNLHLTKKDPNTSHNSGPPPFPQVRKATECCVTITQTWQIEAKWTPTVVFTGPASQHTSQATTSTYEFFKSSTTAHWWFCCVGRGMAEKHYFSFQSFFSFFSLIKICWILCDQCIIWLNFLINPIKQVLFLILQRRKKNKYRKIINRLLLDT